MERPTLTDGVVALRPSRPDDVDALTAGCQDPETQRWSLALPRPFVREHAVEFIARGPSDAAAGTAFHFVAVEADDVPLGSFSVMGGELGYWVAPQARGRGVATRGVTLLRDWAHAALGRTRLELLIHPDNTASCRVAERAGFADSGERRIPPRGQDPDPHAVYVWSAA
jgi:RimJ/RimL family protein N-acetyltransferase